MASQVDIFNIALGALGQTAVDTLDPANTSAAAKKLLPFADAAFNMVLEEHEWRDATQPVALTALSVTGYNPYPYIYGLPKDFVRMAGADSTDAWYVGTFLGDDDTRQRVIYAREPMTNVSIVVRLPWDQLPYSLGMVVAYSLAWLACQAVTGKTDLKQTLWGTREEMVARAKISEAYNGHDDPAFDNLFDMRRTAI